MRKLTIISLAILLTMFLSAQAFAAGTVTQAWTYPTSKVKVLTFSWTADAAAATVPATASNDNMDGYIILVVTDPGTTAPTDNYDITLTDGNSVDAMGGNLADRDTANTEQAVPKIGTVYGGRYVSGILTLNISNNAVNSATGTVKIYIER